MLHNLQIEISPTTTAKANTLNYIDLNLPSKAFFLWINRKHKKKHKKIFTILQNNFIAVYFYYFLSMENSLVSHFPVYRLFPSFFLNLFLCGFKVIFFMHWIVFILGILCKETSSVDVGTYFYYIIISKMYSKLFMWINLNFRYIWVSYSCFFCCYNC